MAKPTDLRDGDLVSIPAYYWTATGDPNDDLAATVETVEATRVRLYVHGTDTVRSGDLWIDPQDVTLVERLGEDGTVVWHG